MAHDGWSLHFLAGACDSEGELGAVRPQRAGPPGPVETGSGLLVRVACSRGPVLDMDLGRAVGRPVEAGNPAMGHLLSDSEG